MVQPIVRYPAGVLTDIAEPVTEFDEQLQRLAADLATTCEIYEGVGLAAPQIGISQRVVFIKTVGQEPLVLVNPSWKPLPSEPALADTALDEEGCLSLPGVRVDIERAWRIEVQALTINREPLVFVAEGLRARIIQHECDHLEGVVIIDHLPPTKRSLVLHAYRKNLKKQTRRFNSALRGRVA